VAWYKDEALVKAALANPDTAPIPERVRVMLHFLARLSLTPDAVGADDVRALHRAGLDDDAIEEAAYVAACFNIIDRVADAFDFTPSSARALKWVPRILLRLGYGAGAVPG
jgi:uncharacterized peroxidase-related enzyme